MQLLHAPKVSAHLLKDDGVIPNNARLPLLLYQSALDLPNSDAASAIEQLLSANQWGGSWRNGIYTYHHYHSTAHEVLAIFSGSATVQLGGESGITLKLQRGDVVIIPAGVAHKNLGSSADFRIVGAYPDGQDWDMCYGTAGERPQSDKNIEGVPLPVSDPIYGANGPLLEHWRA